MFFSVITPVFNRADLLRQMVESVVAQRFTDYEIIVVDDGSTDGTWKYLSSLGPTVHALRQSNLGPGAARNLGLRHARGEYVAFLDSDDVWFPWSLQSYADVIRRTGSPSFIAGKPLLFSHDLQLSRAQEQRATFRCFPDYLASSDEWRWWGVSSFVMRREAVLKHGGFSETNINGEDADLALKLGVAPGFVQVTGPMTFGYREHTANITVNLDKCVAGVWHKIRTEDAGEYPGGESRARERWHVLTRHARPIALACLNSGKRVDAWRLYRATFYWHLQLRRWKFLLGFPFRTLVPRTATVPPEPGPP